MNWEAFLDHLRNWLASRGLLDPTASWVVGVSGGPDSTLLLHALHALGQRDDIHWQLHAAHFHHGLRGAEADEDEAFVAQVADQLNIRFHSERADIRARVASDGGSTEEVARTSRYEFLERVALQTGSNLIAVAHHADDNAETVLHRICRGTGLRGLAGIHHVRPVQPNSHIRLVRPFVGLRRALIEELCTQQGLNIRVDSMNRSPEFTRGRIRHSVMPLLVEQLNPNVTEALLRLSEHARWLGTYLEDAAARTFDSLVVAEEPGRIVLNVHALLSKQRIIQAEVIRRAHALLAEGEDELSFIHVETILSLAEAPASGKEVHVPGSIAVRKTYDRLEFAPLTMSEPAPEIGTIFVTSPGRTLLPTLGLTLTAEVVPVDADRLTELRHNENRLEEWLDYDRVRPPLVVRGRRDGDRFHPLGAPGAKTIGDFFSDEKVDPDVRARTGILWDQDGPLWVMPLRIDERVKLHRDTQRALRLVLEPYTPHPTDHT